jgi:hypothetical protein
MPLKTQMTGTEIDDYLRKDLLQSVINDVGPCLNLSKSEGGYFGVPKLVMSYVDYLGALYHGYGGEVDTRTGRRIIAKGVYAKKFLRDVFGKIDINYQKSADLLWDMYRNGPMHLYEPMKLQNSGNAIVWIIHKGGRTSPDHLVPVFSPTDNVWALPISIKCLYDDLKEAIQSYATMIATDPNLEQAFRRTADALKIPETTNLQWW